MNDGVISNEEIVYLALGSNIGDRLGNLRRAVDLLRNRMKVHAVSSVYETSPVGVENQPSFFNLVLHATTALSPMDLLAFVKDVEKRVGRRPTFRWGPRVVDVDIVLFGRETVDLPSLRVPHPEMLNRAFVLVPLCELNPHVELPDGTAICTGNLDIVARSGQNVRSIGRLDGSPIGSTTRKAERDFT